LKPNHSDKFTGYRYYSAAQLSRLNRILALKELGLSLDQIQRLLSDKVSTEEMQGMLLLAKAESEQNIQAQHKRIQNIKARLQFIRTLEANQPLDWFSNKSPLNKF
jgi:DNA-binding transcriptional MerR regulator